uniref:D-3-phosphoglycerate dehydrogenase n=1 Tax=Chlorobium chlorochromatii (strain CaD3) TaxID=340177 RepID=Q3AQU0_CHLCH
MIALAKKENENVMKVLITDSVHPQCGRLLLQHGFEVTEKPSLSPKELHAIIADYNILIVRSATSLPAEVLAKATQLELIGRAGTGVDNIDLEAATRQGIVVMSTPGGNAVSAAEHTCAMLLAAARHIPQAMADLKQGNWNKHLYAGIELEGKTLSLIGLGRVGREVAMRMQAFGMRTIAYDPAIADEDAALLDIELLPLHENLLRADVITIHSALDESTYNLLGKETLSLTKPGVIIVNCARGGIINEVALAEALASGHVAAAALDVFTKEPIAATHPLLQFPQVIATPHISASTAEGQEKVAIQMAEQIIAWKRDGILEGAINGTIVELAQLPGAHAYLHLAEKLGATLAQCTPLDGKHITMKTSGEFLYTFHEALSAAVLKGFLAKRHAKSCNYLNAFLVAQEYGITLQQKFEPNTHDFNNLLRVELASGSINRMIGGTVFGEKEVRIVMVDQFLLEFKPEGSILLYTNNDQPDVIARVTQLLLAHHCAMAYLALSLDDLHNSAMSALVVNGKVTNDLLEAIKQLEGVTSLSLLEL